MFRTRRSLILENAVGTVVRVRKLIDVTNCIILNTKDCTKNEIPLVNSENDKLLMDSEFAHAEYEAR